MLGRGRNNGCRYPAQSGQLNGLDILTSKLQAAFAKFIYFSNLRFGKFQRTLIPASVHVFWLYPEKTRVSREYNTLFQKS